MKELSIEEKAKRYDIALDKIKRLLGTGSSCSREELEYVFPELAESREDERIRKALIDGFKRYNDGVLFNGCLVKNIVAWLEKKCEQKPADETKFKVGDWVVYCNDDVDLITGIEENGYSINNSGYIPFVCASDVRLWTIQDAKDGDVLATLDYILIFKQHLEDNGGVSYCHYDFTANTPRFNWNEDRNWYFGKEAIVHPSTKEQRDLLFQKMKEAGYEWDAENKELKKIEQKSVKVPKFKVGDIIRHKEQGFTCKIIAVDTEYRLSGCNGNHLPFDFQDAWELVEHKPAEWSEEDEKKRKFLIKGLEDRMGFGWASDPFSREELINWLKSLKNRFTWKPSVEQIKVCKEVYADILSAKGFDLGTVNNELNRLEEELKNLKE